MPKIFISYSRTDESFARKLATNLQKLGADIWIHAERFQRLGDPVLVCARLAREHGDDGVLHLFEMSLQALVVDQQLLRWPPDQQSDVLEPAFF